MLSNVFMFRYCCFSSFLLSSALSSSCADVAELVDAVDSKSSSSNRVLVRFQSSALRRTKSLKRGFIRFFHFLT